MGMRPTCSTADLRFSGGRFYMDNNRLYQGCAEDDETLRKAVSLVSHQLGMDPAYDGPADAMNHYSGSCKLGDCVDPKNLLVRGTDNVFVADSSLFPGPIWGHPAFTVIAVALKAAEILAQ